MSKRLCLIISLMMLLWSISVVGAQDRETHGTEKSKDSQVERKTGAIDNDVVRFKEIVVTTTPIANPVTPVTSRFATQRNVVTDDQIKEQNSLDFQSTLRDVPGVMYQSKNLMGAQTSHSLYIRGRGADHPSADFAILYDDVPRYGALFGQVLGDGIALSTIGSVDVYKSPQPSEFGSGYASINVKPRYLKEEGQEGNAEVSAGSFGTFGQSLSAGVKKGPFDIYVAQSWASTDGHRDHSRAQQQSYYANTGYQLAEHWTLRFLANYVEGQTAAPMPETTPNPINGVSWPMAERFDTSTFLSTLSLNNHYDRAFGYIKAYLNETDFDLLQELTNGVRYAAGTGGLWSRQKAILYGVRAKEKMMFGAGGEVVIGMDVDVAELKNTQRTYSGLAVAGINGGLAERIWDFPRTILMSPYLALNYLFGRSDGFHAVPSAGYRYLYHNEFESSSSYQAGLVAGYAHTDLHLHYARGVNYPSPIVVMNMVLTNSPLSNGNEYWKKIKPETVDHYEIGLTHTWPQRASLGMTAFYDEGRDRYLAYMFGSIPVTFNDPNGQYIIRGLEVTGTFVPMKKLECFVGATLLDARATGANGIERKHMPYTPGFQFQAGINWSFWEHFRARLDMQYLQDVYAATNMRSGTFNFNELTDANKLEDFVLANGRLGYLFDYKPLRVVGSEVYVAVNNIFNRHYEYAKGYGMPGITVFAGVTLKFQ